MAAELKVPQVGESITEVQVSAWHKAPGEFINRDEVVAEVESDKATMEISAPISGTISQVLKKVGEKAEIGEVIGYMEEGTAPAQPEAAKAEKKAAPKAAEKPAAKSVAKPAEKPAEKTTPRARAAVAEEEPARVMPAAKRVMAQRGLESDDVEAGGPGGRVLKEDALRAEPAKAQAPREAAPAPSDERGEEEIPLTPMRKRIAERLVEAQQTAALLTTFNEVDMTAIMALRKEDGPAFLEKHGVKLGFMSFFVKAVVDALQAFPKVNAQIRGENIIYHHYYDIGIAVGGGKGLVVPVMRDAETLSLAEIEKAISDFGARAKANKITLDELAGGTFTISNGGIYGSLLSTPIVNPPQSGILGLHAIQDRPVARDGQVVIRPMMYLALTYDHRLVDGREAVTFLRRVKDSIERPARLLLTL